MFVRLLAAFVILAIGSLEVFGQPGYRMLISGAFLNYVGIIDEDGNEEWRTPEPKSNQTNDSWPLPDGNIVYAYLYGFKIVRPDFDDPSETEVIWDRPTPDGGETHSCQPLEGGKKFVIGESYPDSNSYIVELDTSGHEYLRIKLPIHAVLAHQQLRQVRKTPQGTYLVTQHISGGDAYEFDSTGTCIQTFPGGQFGGYRLPNGNTLVSTGREAKTLIEYDADANIVWQVGPHDIPGVELVYVAQAARLPNGNTILANWMGHGTGDGPGVMEITPEKEMVWGMTDAVDKLVASFKILYTGCMDPNADNYDSTANIDDGSCILPAAIPLKNILQRPYSVVQQGGRIQVSVSDGRPYAIRLYSVGGHAVKAHEMNEDEYFLHGRGVYLLTVSTQQNQYLQKIFVLEGQTPF